jgi:hypothetical protein
VVGVETEEEGVEEGESSEIPEVRLLVEMEGKEEAEPVTEVALKGVEEPEPDPVILRHQGCSKAFER